MLKGGWGGSVGERARGRGAGVKLYIFPYFLLIVQIFVHWKR